MNYATEKRDFAKLRGASIEEANWFDPGRTTEYKRRLGEYMRHFEYLKLQCKSRLVDGDLSAHVEMDVSLRDPVGTFFLETLVKKGYEFSVHTPAGGMRRLKFDL